MRMFIYFLLGFLMGLASTNKLVIEITQKENKED